MQTQAASARFVYASGRRVSDRITSDRARLARRLVACTMPITVTVKWGKQKFENIELDTAEPVEVFKAQLFALTNVPPERQKIMGVKGGYVKVCAIAALRRAT